MLNKTKGNAAPAPSFVGAIKDVQVNKEAINLAGRSIECIKGHGSIIYSSFVVFILVIVGEKNIPEFMPTIC